MEPLDVHTKAEYPDDSCEALLAKDRCRRLITDVDANSGTKRPPLDPTKWRRIALENVLRRI